VHGDLRKLFYAVLATVVGGLILLWLGRHKPGPEVMLIDFTAGGGEFVPPPRLIKVHATTYNEGDAIARDCRLVWNTQGLEGSPPTTPRFSLAPKERREFLLTAIFEAGGNFAGWAEVRCSNDTSSRVESRVIVAAESISVPPGGVKLDGKPRP
jgi:hypothetical protein